MSVKKNFFFNSILLVSQYIFPMLVFPYITRIFGATTLGLVSFVDGICDYFILFSALGLTLTGLRATAKYQSDKEQLSKTFSELLTLHLIVTAIFMIVYIALILSLHKFQENSTLFYISMSKLLFNVFLVEWFYKGIENFKFITVRTVSIKAIYVLCVFLFVKSKQDYLIYYSLTCAVIVINAIVNFAYTRGKISLTFRNLNIKQHLTSFFTVGLYLIVTSMYTSFNIGFLGMVSSTTSVGYYSTASKLFSIILGIFTALNTVLMPRLSYLIVQNEQDAFINLINKSFNFVITLCFPIIMCGIIMAPQIIHVISGPGFEGAVICFKLIIPLLFILGIAQIFAHQILMSLKKDRELLIASMTGGIIGLSLNFLLVPHYHELATSIVLLISEVSVTAVLYYFTTKCSPFRISVPLMLKNLLASIPYLIICILTGRFILNPFLALGCASAISLLYFVSIQIFYLKNDLVLTYWSQTQKKLNLAKAN